MMSITSFVIRLRLKNVLSFLPPKYLCFMLLNFLFFSLFTLHLQITECGKDGKINVPEMREKEKIYFKDHIHFSKLPPGLFGVENLSKKLTSLLVHIFSLFVFYLFCLFVIISDNARCSITRLFFFPYFFLYQVSMFLCVFIFFSDHFNLH
jgi:hypothetical protein